MEKKQFDALISILNDIAHSLRIMSGRSEKVTVTKKQTYADRYFAPSDDK